MKLLSEFHEQIKQKQLGKLKRVWLTSFNLSVDFIEQHLLPIVVDMENPKNRMDYEVFQKELVDKKIDFRVFCDKRMLNNLDTKRTSIDVFGVSPRSFDGFSEHSLFHPKVIYIEDIDGKAILGAGSANLTMSGWGRNQEVFAFKKVSTAEQSAQIRLFFKGIIEGFNLRLGRNYWGKEKSWQFVHSFQPETFLEQFVTPNDKELAIWSPYFPKDLSAFIQEIKTQSMVKELKVSITPDRIEGKVIRTQWSEGIQRLVDSGELIFYENAIAKHPSTELCHAKIWKTVSRLAIGSWNFTGPGANSLLDEKTMWSENNNIEAGFIFKHKDAISNSLGKKINIGRECFASIELLEDENLEIPEELPFDIKVFFNWQVQQYTFEGKWWHSDKNKTYKIKIPDLGAFIIPTKRTSSSIGLAPHLISYPKELLTQHSFDIYADESLVYRGLIIETEVLHRRVQTYDSLSDLLDSLITNVDPENPTGSTTRGVLQVDKELFEEEGVNTEVSIEMTASYFRLFQAMDKFEKNLIAANTLEHLEKLLFVYPGCLSELAEKIKYGIDHPKPEVFNWFLAKEFNVLVDIAHKQYSKLRPKGTSIKPPENKWQQLKVNSPLLPVKFAKSKRYLNLIKKECGYGTN